jgi:hypothetical protein
MPSMTEPPDRDFITDRMAWLGLSLGFGIFGGLCGAYLVGLPLTIGIPILLVRFARYRGWGSPTMVSYAVGVALVPVWIVGSQTFLETPNRPTSGSVVISGILVGVAMAMVLASRLRIVRRHR